MLVGSAEYFSCGAVSLLNSLNIVNSLSFGSSSDDIQTLNKIANVLIEEPDEFKIKLQSELKKGISYPTARSNSLKYFFKKQIDEKILNEIILNSNNILGIEYLKVLNHMQSNISPITIKRICTEYNSTSVEKNICSATAIREMFKSNNIEKLPDVLSKENFEILNNEILSGKAPMFLQNFEKEILYALRMNSVNDLANISDISEGLENLIKKVILESSNIEEIIEKIKSKRYTRTRIQRILTHILLDIKQTDIEKYKMTPQYARVLGYTKNGEKIISEMSKKSQIPIITSVNKFMKTANDDQKNMLEKDILATNIYTLGYQVPNYKKVNLDYTKNIILAKD